ncbi:MAG: hypothetical protein F6K23_40020 [Okeania sp. SIO2C9]|uniref:endonuclease/exonuclease/phosphatase family protein n=1 Tax=Okeania sp. SIO2C9 TaxID=2607791 RepID=UPI0013BEC717|nr:endonuclease/exonuclease/phosphatase family protein [Okeania sp. SIO2C9]NEQ78639.1 hypothetical protein [Okeania sp. SIO2C9]
MNLVTWNMQGSSASTDDKWNQGILQFIKQGAEVCSLQECGSVPASAKPETPTNPLPTGVELYTWKGSANPTKYILFYPADPGGNRCNLAVVSVKKPKNVKLLESISSAKWRPVLGAEYDGSTRYCFTIHAMSGSGNDIEGLVKAINVAVGDWVVAGDFNRQPDKITSGTPGTVCPPNGPTHPSKAPVSKYDYAIKKATPSVTGQVYQVPILSDHLAVAFVL